VLEELLAGPGIRSLVQYLVAPETRLAVLIPGVISLAILGFYARQRKVSHRLQLVWVLTLGMSFYFARWEITEELQRLYIYSAFSVACVLLLFKRIYVAPALAYALTFLALWWVDVVHALCRALECGADLDQFYRGVGGAGVVDGLVVVPLLTAAAVAYAAGRIRSRGERMAEI
jgi:hypothetical protein